MHNIINNKDFIFPNIIFIIIALPLNSENYLS